MDENSISVGDVVTIDVAVFHKSGVNGACHIEENIEYVVMDSDGVDLFLVLTTKQEEKLNNSISGVLYSMTVDNSVDSIENHPQVHKLINIQKG